MILNANALNGAFGSGLRVICSPVSGSVPTVSGISNGEGKYRHTPSKAVWTPLFLKEEPHFGTHLSGFGNKDLKTNYLTEILPNYFLIDKTGTIISERLDEPSTDEGRSLINHIESLLYKKWKK